MNNQHRWAALLGASRRPRDEQVSVPELLGSTVALGLTVGTRTVGCSITEISTANEDNRFRTVVSSGEGPCIRAASTGAPTRAALNFYSAEPAGFRTRQADEVARLLARCAARLLGAPDRDRQDETAIATAVRSGELIGRAESMLMKQEGLSRPQAFERLSELARARACTVWQLARKILDQRYSESTR